MNSIIKAIGTISVLAIVTIFVMLIVETCNRGIEITRLNETVKELEFRLERSEKKPPIERNELIKNLRVTTKNETDCEFYRRICEMIENEYMNKHNQNQGAEK